jgi:hypothetical protein
MIHPRETPNHAKSLYAQRALGAGDLALLACHLARSHTDGHSERLEGALGPVVVVVAADAVDVHGEAGGLGEALQAVGHHLSAQLSEPLALQSEVDDAVRSVGEVDDSAGEGFVERSVGVPETGEASGRAEGLGEGVTESNAAVLSGVVVVNC